VKPTARDLIGAARRQEASDGRRAGGLPAGLRVRVARGIGAPRLAAIGLGAVGSSVYFVLGVVAKRSLGLTPIVFVVATAFFAITTLTYLEANSVHPERGGSSTFSTVTTAPRSDAARTRSANHEAFVSGEIRGADRASMKCALKTWIPTGSSTSMKPTNRARSAWWKCDGGR